MTQEYEELKDDVTLVMENEEEFSSRPKTKPAQQIRGRLLIWPETKQYYFEGQKASQEKKMEVVYDKGDVKLLKTLGEKDSSYILKSKCPGDCADPLGTTLAKIHDKLKKELKAEPKIHAPVFVIDRPDELQVWAKKKDKKLKALMTLDMAQPPQVVSLKLQELMIQINKIIYNYKNV